MSTVIFGDLAGRYARYVDKYPNGGPEPGGFIDLPPALVAATEAVGGRNWGVFDSDGSGSGPLQIQRFDDVDDPDAGGVGEQLVDDCEAWMEFMAAANDGQAEYELTLHALLLANPIEFGNVLAWQASHQLPEVSGVRTVRCPDDDRGPQADAFPAGIPDIVGCGTVFTAAPDDEGLFDCPACGMWFTS